MQTAMTMRPSNIKALRQRKADLAKSMRAMIDKCMAEKRVRTEAENEVYNRTKAEFDENEKMLEVEEEVLEAERGIQGHEDPNAAADRLSRGSYFGRNHEAAGEQSRTSSIIKTGGRRYAEMFGKNLSMDGWRSPNEFFRVLHSGLHDARLRPVSMSASAGMGEDIPSNGGFFVPDQVVAQILDASLESEIVRPRANIEPMTSETKKIAGFDSSDNSSGNLYGAVSANWAAELQDGTPQVPKTRLIQLTANKLFLYIPVSNELIADGGSDFETLLTAAIIKAASWHLDYAFLQGSGAGRPLGVLNASSLVTISKESGQVASTIVYANIAKMAAAIHPACFGNSVWVANPTTLPQLLQMTLNVKNVAGTENVGGSATPILSQEGDTFRMLTRPVLFTEKVPAVGTVGDIMLVDFSQYSVGIRRDIALEKSSHVGFANDSTAYRATVRIDGQPRWAKAFTPRNGSQQSWAIALQTRS